jgi:hypothetical protein
VTADDDPDALELLELDEDAEPVHGVVWGPVLEDLARSAEEIAAKTRENGLEDPEH